MALSSGPNSATCSPATATIYCLLLGPKNVIGVCERCTRPQHLASLDIEGADHRIESGSYNVTLPMTSGPLRLIDPHSLGTRQRHYERHFPTHAAPLTSHGMRDGVRSNLRDDALAGGFPVGDWTCGALPSVRGSR